MRLSSYLDFAVGELLQMEERQFVQPTPYDTCWAAGLTNKDGTLAYPRLLSWLMRRQHPDGSWGSQVPYVHDRLLTTLAVVLLLARVGHRRQDQRQRLAGERYIWRQAGNLYHDAERTVGFEMIIPTLLAEAREMGLELPYAQLRHYEVARRKKLSLLPERIFEARTPALHSLEAFIRDVNLGDKAADLLLANGSMLGSPSATACFLGQFPDWQTLYPESVAYLENLLALGDAGLPAVAPCDIYARAWILDYLHYGNLLDRHTELLQPFYSYLLENWRPEGVGFTSFALPDSDDTAMVLTTLHRAGYEMDGTCLLAYEQDQHFAVYEYEVNPSVSANLHILAALETLPEGDRQRAQDKILGYLLRARHHGSYWSDKWNASVYYPTSKALMILATRAPDMLDDTLDWFLNTQHPNGAWGQYMPTAEETAQALLALLHYHRTVRPLPTGPLHEAARYLIDEERPFGHDYPELWITKVLYAPTFAIRGVILAALNLYQDTFGDRDDQLENVSSPVGRNFYV